MAAKYTVRDGSRVYGTGLSLEDAAFEILTADRRQCELRRVDGGWELWIRQQVANIGWHQHDFYAVDSEDDAWQQACLDAVAKRPWPQAPEAILECDVHTWVDGACETCGLERHVSA